MKKLLLITLICMCYAACTTDPVEISTIEPKTRVSTSSEIYFRVRFFDAHTSQPLAGLEVEIEVHVGYYPYFVELVSGTTDANGMFSASASISPEVYTYGRYIDFMLSTHGYIDGADTHYSNYASYFLSATSSESLPPYEQAVANGINYPDVGLFRSGRGLRNQVKYYGRIVDLFTEQYIEDASVRLTTPTSTGEFVLDQAYGYIDERGSFEVELYPTWAEWQNVSRIQLVISKPGYRTVFHEISVPDYWDAIRIGGCDLGTIKVQWCPPNSVVFEGRVIDQNTGYGVEGATVVIGAGPNSGMSNPVVAMAITDEVGYYATYWKADQNAWNVVREVSTTTYKSGYMYNSHAITQIPSYATAKIEGIDFDAMRILKGNSVLFEGMVIDHNTGLGVSNAMVIIGASTTVGVTGPAVALAYTGPSGRYVTSWEVDENTWNTLKQVSNWVEASGYRSYNTRIITPIPSYFTAETSGINFDVMRLTPH